jgi:parallel beta-helix repeat protein
MGNLPKLACTTLLIALVCGLVFVTSIHFGMAQTSTPANGLITSDTTWTKANSPYNLVGPVGVSQGVTLTIEPGTTVNLNNYYMVVNGTLIAKGTSTDKIQINGVDGSPPGIPLGSSLAISFTYGITINNYNQYGAGSTIENAIINSVRIALGSSGKINNCTIIGFVSAGQSSIISNNLVAGLIFAGGTSQVLNNNISGGIQAEYGSPTISNNVIFGGGRGDGIWLYLPDNIVISGNTITGCEEGIFAQGGNGVIERNFIADNTNGITISYGASVTIQENTIEKNHVGLYVSTVTSPIVTYNNLLYNSYNLYLSTSVNLNATNNFWGTTDTQAINQTIFDNKNDFNLGTVTFVPFLTTPNTASPAITTPSPTPTPNASASPSQNSTSTPNQSGSNNVVFLGLDWAEIAIIALLGIIAVLLVTTVMFLHKRSIKQNPQSVTT